MFFVESHRTCNFLGFSVLTIASFLDPRFKALSFLTTEERSRIKSLVEEDLEVLFNSDTSTAESIQDSILLPENVNSLVFLSANLRSTSWAFIIFILSIIKFFSIKYHSYRDIIKYVCHDMINTISLSPNLEQSILLFYHQLGSLLMEDIGDGVMAVAIINFSKSCRCADHRENETKWMWCIEVEECVQRSELC